MDLVKTSFPARCPRFVQSSRRASSSGRVLVELEKAKTEVHSKDIIAQLVPLIVAQWQIANAKFTPPVTIKEKSIRTKVERLWWMVEEVKRGRAGKGLRKKVELLLDKLVDITTCPHTIHLCNEPGSGCQDIKKCKVQAHIKCDCPQECKIPVLELRCMRRGRREEAEDEEKKARPFREALEDS